MSTVHKKLLMSRRVSRMEEGAEIDHSAKQLLDQAQFLWADQVKFADEIRDKRKAYSIWILLLGALGIFRVGWYASTDQVPVVTGWASTVLLIVLTVGLLCFFIGAYMLYSESSTFRVSIVRMAESPREARRLRRFFIMYTPGITIDDLRRARRTDSGRSKLFKSRVSDLARLTPEEMDVFLQAPPEQGVLHRTMLLYRAYEKLARANNRVNRRIEGGILIIGCGYLMLLVFFLIYMWHTLV